MKGAELLSVDSRKAARQDSTSIRLGVTARHLDALVSGRSPLVVYRGAVPQDVCERVARSLEEGGGFREWRLGASPDAPASDYAKLGYTKTDVFVETGFRMAAGRPAPEEYLRRALEAQELLENACQPSRPILDEIFEEIAALPGYDCRPERCPESGRRFLPCVVRRMAPGGRRVEGNVHMDTIAPGRTISANVYLRTPEGAVSGGELLMHPVAKSQMQRYLNAHFFMTVDLQNFYPDKSFYTEEILASERLAPFVHRPVAGDVVLLDPAYPHAVRDFSAPPGFHRVSLQTFLQVSRAGPWHSKTRLLQYAI